MISFIWFQFLPKILVRRFKRHDRVSGRFTHFYNLIICLIFLGENQFEIPKDLLKISASKNSVELGFWKKFCGVLQVVKDSILCPIIGWHDIACKGLRDLFIISDTSYNKTGQGTGGVNISSKSSLASVTKKKKRFSNLTKD